MDDFCIQYVGIFNKGVFNKWGNTVVHTAKSKNIVDDFDTQKKFFLTCATVQINITFNFLSQIEKKTQLCVISQIAKNWN